MEEVQPAPLQLQLDSVVEVQPAPLQLQPESVVDENPKSRHFCLLLNKNTIGLHAIRRSQVDLGKNTLVVTQEGNMKVVNSMDPRFKDRSVIRKSPELVQEIILTGRFVYYADAHRELTWQYFESHPAKLPKGVKIPDRLSP